MRFVKLMFGPRNRWAQTPIEAAAIGDMAQVQRLIRNRGSLNISDSDGRTPILWAAWLGNTEVVKVLGAARADVNIPDEDGDTPIMLAAYGGHTDVVKILLGQHANLSVSDKKGVSAIDYAAKADEKISNLLLEAGSPPAKPLRKDAGPGGYSLIPARWVPPISIPKLVSASHMKLAKEFSSRSNLLLNTSGLLPNAGPRTHSLNWGGHTFSARGYQRTPLKR